MDLDVIIFAETDLDWKWLFPFKLFLSVQFWDCRLL